MSAIEQGVQPEVVPTLKDSWVFHDGDIKRYSDVRLGLLTHALQYGTGCFEGIRAYWNQGQKQLFCLFPEAHFRRIKNSTRILRIELPYSLEEMVGATVEILRRNGYREDTYIKVMAFKSQEDVGVRLHGLQDSFAICTTPMGDYVDVDAGIRCMVSSWRRVDDNAAPARSKTSGIYVNSALAKTEAVECGFDEAIVLTQDGHVAEGSAENLFMVRGGTLITPPGTDNILEGVTRGALTELAREDLWLEVVERSIDRSEMYIADEVLLCGTGAQVSPVVEIDHRQVGDGRPGPITRKLQQLYFDAARGRLEKRLDWVTPVY